MSLPERFHWYAMKRGQEYAVELLHELIAIERTQAKWTLADRFRVTKEEAEQDVIFWKLNGVPPRT